MTTELESKTAQFVMIKGGAMVFDEPATLLAQELGLEQGIARNQSPYVRLKDDQLDAATGILQNAGYDVTERRTVAIARTETKVTVLDKAALDAADNLGVKHLLRRTDSGRDKLSLELEYEADLKRSLKECGYVVTVEEVQSTMKPKAVFRESQDGETYFLFDGSASNVARFLEREPNRTPGNRPTLEFSRQEYKQLKEQLKEGGFDVSTKDLELNATISRFDSKNGAGAVIIGTPAIEVAGAFDLKTEYTKPSAKTGAVMSKVTLRGEEQIQAARQALEFQGYQVEETQMEQPLLGKKFANIMEWQGENPGAMVFGDAAKALSETAWAAEAGVKLGQTQSGKPMMHLLPEQKEGAKAQLVAAGYELNIQNANQMLQQQQQKNPAAVAPKPAPVKKKAVGDDGR